MDLDIIKGKKVAELREIAAALKIPGAAAMKKAEIIALLTKMHEEAQQEEAQNAAAQELAVESKPEASEEEKPAPKRRGRPKKNAVKEADAPKEEAASEPDAAGEQLSLEVKTEEKPKRGGRRRKAKAEEAPVEEQPQESAEPQAAADRMFSAINMASIPREKSPTRNR